MIVVRCTPVMRVTARKEFPSTNAATTCFRSSVLNLFMSALCLSGQAMPTGNFIFYSSVWPLLFEQSLFASWLIRLPPLPFHLLGHQACQALRRRDFFRSLLVL